jgi:tetratricopeptide (TPR) repeat protein
VGQATTDAPPLPNLAADVFPEASRAAIVAAFRDAQARPFDANAVGALAMLLQAWEQFDVAAIAYQRAQALAPDNADWWYLGGVTDTARALPASAARQFARTAALAPHRRRLIALRLADAQLAAGADDAAATLYRDLVASPEHAAAGWYGLGRLALRRDDLVAARQALEKALALSPDFGAAHYALALVQRRSGDADAASVSLARQQRCPACGPVPDDPWQARIAAFRDDAFALLSRGIAAASASTTAATAAAIQLHEAALVRRELRGEAHVNLIELYRRAGDPDRAKQHYQAALAEPAFEADAHRQFAVVLLEQKQPDEALLLFERATTLAPRDGAAWRGRGLALETLGRLADAASSYGKALELAPDDHQARFAMARLAMRAGRVDDAITQLEALRLPQRPETPRYLFALSTAQLRRGRHDDAIRAATDALTLARQLGDEQMATFITGELRKLKPTP